MCTKLFDAALRRSVYPGDSGSSAIDDKYPSSFLLNVDRSTIVRFRMEFGSALNKFPPWTAKLASTSPFTLEDAVGEDKGTTHIRPCLMEYRGWILSAPTFGARFSRIFQMYMTLYRSLLL